MRFPRAIFVSSTREFVFTEHLQWASVSAAYFKNCIISLNKAIGYIGLEMRKEVQRG